MNSISHSRRDLLSIHGIYFILTHVDIYIKMLISYPIRYIQWFGPKFVYTGGKIWGKRDEKYFKMCNFKKFSCRSEWQTIKQGAMFYILLTVLVIPSAICSQQDYLPVYNPTPEELHAMLDISSLWGEVDLTADGQDQTDEGQSPPVKVPPFHNYVLQAAQEYHVDPALIRAIIMVESSNNPRAVSHRGAQGLMQLMPTTAKWLGVQDTFNPEANINGGVRYFKRLLDRFDGDVELALAAYNAGSRYVRKYNGVPPFKTTRRYIKKVLKYHQHYSEEMAVNNADPSAV